jgi:hypothetical protein
MIFPMNDFLWDEASRFEPLETGSMGELKQESKKRVWSLDVARRARLNKVPSERHKAL